MRHVLSIFHTHLPVLPSLRTMRRHPVALAGLVLILALAGCDGKPGPGEAESSAKTYETRGIVRQLPTAGTPGSQLFIHHEAIPSFESIDGEVTGMDAMAMEFPIADAQMLDGLGVGDKVAFTLRIDWDDSPPLEITRLEKLPPETLLSFEKAAGEDDSDDGAEAGVDAGADAESDAGHAHHEGDHAEPAPADMPPADQHAGDHG